VLSNGVEVQALVAAQIFHEGWHVKGVQSVCIVDVEMLPRSAEILVHILVSSVVVHFLLLLEDFSGGGLRPFLIHEEVTSWATLIILLFKCVFLEDVMHELVGRILVEAIWEFSRILFALRGNISVTSEEISMLGNSINLGSSLLWCLVVIVVTHALINLHVLLVIILLLLTIGFILA